MKTWLVGGAVRDRLLGVESTERDWVVTGSTPEEMQRQGFRAVGRDFPVFLHPETGEEYALARTERKSGPGYHGFVFNASPEVTLEEDLRRRDLTVNAMALDADGHIIDPWGGQADLQNRLLRHVSPAFVEDPLRVLRVARFAARFHCLGFRVAEETMALMAELAASGELEVLTPERVWQETATGLMEADPQRYFQVLEDCGALAVLFPELAALRGVPQPEQHHPEVDTLEHQYLALKVAARRNYPEVTRFALLVHDLGKGQTPAEHWPAHHGHEERGAEQAEALAERIRAPREHRLLGILAARWHTHAHRALELRPGTLWKLLRALDCLRRPERLERFLEVCEADARGRAGREEQPWPQGELIRGAAAAAREIDIAPLREQGLEGAALGEAIEQARIRALAEYQTLWHRQH